MLINSVQNMIHKPDNPRITLPWEASFWGGNYIIFGVAGSILLRDCKFQRHLSLDAYFLKRMPISLKVKILWCSTTSPTSLALVGNDEFHFFPTKFDDGGGIVTQCSTYYLIINVSILINLEDMTIKNMMLSKNIHKPHNFEFPTTV